MYMNASSIFLILSPPFPFHLVYFQHLSYGNNISLSLSLCLCVCLQCICIYVCVCVRVCVSCVCVLVCGFVLWWGGGVSLLCSCSLEKARGCQAENLL